MENNEAKKIRWNVSNAMEIVCEELKGSKLKIKETELYKTAMQRLMTYFNATKVQIWLICLVCDFYVENEDSMDMRNLIACCNVSGMKVIGWKNEIRTLVEKGYFEYDRGENNFQPVNSLLQAISENYSFIPVERRQEDEVDFLNNLAKKYENRRYENKSSWDLQFELGIYEERHKELDLVKRVRKEFECDTSRYFLYDVANDVLKGGESDLNHTICDLWDGSQRYTIATQMLEEKHELFKKGVIEFKRKGNLSEATISLSSKGKILIFGDKAFLFEDLVDEKSLIKHENIKAKQLFYSDENQKEIGNLKEALKEEKFIEIQKRLSESSMPVGVAVLLYGAPGTGKTESVYQIARETERSIVHVDISDSKSAWFGESEKKIKMIFTKYKNACDICRKKGEKIPILLFNEADAIISKRKDSTIGNVAQTENAIQNIILEEMENLDGIMIATTNLEVNMDPAFERRFLFKVKFENPSLEAKKSIWLNKLDWLNSIQAEKIAADYELSGGQIDNIVRKIKMNEVITGKTPDFNEILFMCKNEKLGNSTAKKIGFGI